MWRSLEGSTTSSTCSTFKLIFLLHYYILVEVSKGTWNHYLINLMNTFQLLQSSWNEMTKKVANKAAEVAAHLQDDVEKSPASCWVGSRCPHSKDIDSDVMPVRQIEVLKARNRYLLCEKSICWQRCCVPLALRFLHYQVASTVTCSRHGSAWPQQGPYLASLNRWIRVDPRGNTGRINAQFDLPGGAPRLPPKSF